MTTHSSAITLTPKYYRCRLGRRQIDNLFETASAGLNPGSVEVSTERDNRTFTAATLDDLVHAVREAPLPSDPDQWANLAFTAKDAADKCAVTMHLAPDHVDVSVSGSDPTWVYGADAQIRLFLENEAVGGSSKPRSEAHRKMRSASAGGFLWTFVLVYAVVWFPGSTAGAPPGAKGEALDMYVNKPLAPASLSILAVIALYFAIRAIQHWARDRVLKGRLEVTSELPGGGWWRTLSTTEQLTAAGVLVAMLAALGTLISAGADVFKSG